MAEATMPIPVYMPGDEARKFNKSQGRAVITEDGKIEIKMYSAEHGKELYKLFTEGNLVAVGFDYKPVEASNG